MTNDRDNSLRKAIRYYENTYRVYTEGQFPMDWAQTQNNIGLAKMALSQEINDNSLLEEVLTTFSLSARGFRTVGLINDAKGSEKKINEIERILASKDEERI
jgi:hypothetical protein